MFKMKAQVVTLANSIVGVSVLAMPFCFKFCGIFLATLMLVLSAILTRILCHFLIKAGTMSKRRTFEMLAYHTFGHGGKFMVEITIIGYLVGTLIAFLVVIGDLGPPIVAEFLSIENNHALRTIVMTGLAVFVALPLGLLRNIDSLGSVSSISFIFYFFLVIKILNEGLGSLGSDKMNSVSYWRPSGALQCIPIVAMALSCQTQVFSIYESLPDPSLHRMNEVVKKAVYLCTAFYFSVGCFGYIAFSTEGISGNILMSFGPAWTTQIIKACFVLSIVFSVPLCVFPCRASLYSLLYKGGHHSIHDISSNYIPDGKLRLLTVLIVGTTLVIALIIPNIELVLGLVGSTAGCLICLIFPSAMFIRVTSKKTTERLLAQLIFGTGIGMMLLTTYATLYSVDQANANPPEPKFQNPKMMVPDEIILGPRKVNELEPRLIPKKEEDVVKFEPKIPLIKSSLDDQAKQKLSQVEVLPQKVSLAAKPISKASSTPIPPIVKESEKDKLKKEELIDSKREAKNFNPILQKKAVSESVPAAPPIPIKNKSPEPVVGKGEKVEKKANELLKELKEHQAAQKKLLDEQKEILAHLKEHHEQDSQRDKDARPKDENGKGDVAVEKKDGDGKAEESNPQVKDKLLKEASPL